MFSSGDMGEEKITFFTRFQVEKSKRRKNAEEKSSRGIQLEKKKPAGKIIIAYLLKRDNSHPGQHWKSHAGHMPL